MSSFQLHDTYSLAPQVGVLTNLAPDHLDRYEALEDYYADKDRLFLNAGPGSIWVTNGDDVEVLRRTARLRGTHRRFSVHGLPVDATYDRPALPAPGAGRSLVRRFADDGSFQRAEVATSPTPGGDYTITVTAAPKKK